MLGSKIVVHRTSITIGCFLFVHLFDYIKSIVLLYDNFLRIENKIRATYKKSTIALRSLHPQKQ